MKIERIVFGPTAGFMAHLKKQGIAFRVKHDKRYTKHIDSIRFIVEVANYKPYKEHKGLVGLSQMFREVGKKKWEAR